ncbi:hypothetical protein ACH3XW_17620 [Acanthocheilonema viteae]
MRSNQGDGQFRSAHLSLPFCRTSLSLFHTSKFLLKLPEKIRSTLNTLFANHAMFLAGNLAFYLHLCWKCKVCIRFKRDCFFLFDIV